MKEEDGLGEIEGCESGRREVGEGGNEAKGKSRVNEGERGGKTEASSSTESKDGD